jgi:hypothetical protein
MEGTFKDRLSTGHSMAAYPQDSRVKAANGCVFNEDKAEARGGQEIVVFVVDNVSRGRTIKSELLQCSMTVSVHKRSQE